MLALGSQRGSGFRPGGRGTLGDTRPDHDACRDGTGRGCAAPAGCGPSTSGGTSDGRFIADICREVVEFGPLNSSIHKLNEHVAVEDIERLATIYQRTLEKLLT